MKKGTIKGMALLLAVVLVVSVCFVANGKALKAEENEEVYEPVVEEPVEEVTEITVEAGPVINESDQEAVTEEASSETTAEVEDEINAEESEDAADAEKTEDEAAVNEELNESEKSESEEDKAETEESEEDKAETEETEEVFNVEEAYAYYMSLDDAGKAEYLASLSEENREALLNYIKLMENLSKNENSEDGDKTGDNEVAEEQTETEQAEEPEEDYSLDVGIYYTCSDQQPQLGSTITWNSTVNGLKDGDELHYQWQYGLNGQWFDIEGATDSTYVFILDNVTSTYSWRLNVRAY